jgi:hypothetical protein
VSPARFADAPVGRIRDAALTGHPANTYAVFTVV